MKISLITCFVLACSTQAMALDLPSPATLVATVNEPNAQYALPVAAFDGTTVPMASMTGDVERQAWQFIGGARTLSQITQPISASLDADGYSKILDCVSDLCGGFDFRFQIDVLPAPDMYVNLRNYQFMTFVKGDSANPEAAITVLASVAGNEGFLQITQIGSTEPITASSGETSSEPQDARGNEVAQPFSQSLLATGSVVLEGLEFQTGATVLGDGPFTVLKDLAAFLAANPNINVVLVGHTDATGSFEGNVRVSKARATAVRDRLIANYGADETRLAAEGMGYLAPRASNLSEAGREANRRVEAVVLSQNE